VTGKKATASVAGADGRVTGKKAAAPAEEPAEPTDGEAEEPPPP
jgi:hypothetical protein